MNNQQPTPGTLAESEPHPAASNAREWIAKLSISDLMIWKESFASCTIEDNRTAEVCLETLDRLLHSKPVSDWYVLGLAWVMKIGMDVKKARNGHIDWKSVDWDKSSRELEAELDVPYWLVCRKRTELGHKKVGTAKTRHIDWTTVDWGKNNQQLAGELGIQPGSLAGYRQRIGKPSKGHTPRVVSNEMIDSVDWVNTKDITISRQWGVSRERVRQIRLVKKKPRCIITTNIKSSQEIEKWLLDNKGSISGKLASEVAEMCPVADAIDNKYRVMKKVDIQFLWMHKKALAITLDVNWDIPNNLLDWIWGRCENWAAANRYRHNKPKAKYFRNWRIMEQYDFARLPVLVKIVRAEIEKARKVGVKPKIKELQEYGFDVV